MLGGVYLEAEVQGGEIGQGAQVRDAPGQLVAVEVQGGEAGQATQGGDGARAIGEYEVQGGEVGQAVDPGRDGGGGEGVGIAEVQFGEAGQGAQVGDGAGQLVVGKVQGSEAGQAAQSGRDSATEALRREFQLRHPRRGARYGDAVPIVHIFRCRPIQSSGPTERVLEAQQGRAVSGQGRPPVVDCGAALGASLSSHGRRAA